MDLGDHNAQETLRHSRPLAQVCSSALLDAAKTPPSTKVVRYPSRATILEQSAYMKAYGAKLFCRYGKTAA
jgi:hypothetical protein